MRRARVVIDVGATSIMAIAAVAMAVSFFSDRYRPSGRNQSPQPQRIADWREASRHGIRLGAEDAPVVITEFVDFQCPFCRTAQPTVDSILAETDDVAIVIIHLPLMQIHSYAMAAAIAAECAHAQGRFEEMASALFAQQSLLGQRPLLSYAEDAEVPDLPAFAGCITQPPDSFPRLVKGAELASEYSVLGTPTFWVNGKVSSLRTLRHDVDSALAVERLRHR